MKGLVIISLGARVQSSANAFMTGEGAFDPVPHCCQTEGLS